MKITFHYENQVTASQRIAATHLKFPTLFSDIVCALADKLAPSPQVPLSVNLYLTEKEMYQPATLKNLFWLVDLHEQRALKEELRFLAVVTMRVHLTNKKGVSKKEIYDFNLIGDY